MLGLFIHWSSLFLDHESIVPACLQVIQPLAHPALELSIHWFNLFFGHLSIDLSFLGLKFDSHLLALFLASSFALGSSWWPCHHPILVSFYRWFCAFLSQHSRKWAGGHSDRGLFGVLSASQQHTTPYVKNSMKTFLVHVEHTSWFQRASSHGWEGSFLWTPHSSEEFSLSKGLLSLLWMWLDS